MKDIETARAVYNAYNARDLDLALSYLSDDVAWDNGEGHMLQGKVALADHWREQWRKADAKVAIEDATRNGDQLELAVRLDMVREDGKSASMRLRNTLRFSGSRIDSMRIG